MCCCSGRTYWSTSSLLVKGLTPGAYTIVVEGPGYQTGPFGLQWSIAFNGSLPLPSAVGSPTPSPSVPSHSTSPSTTPVPSVSPSLTPSPTLSPSTSASPSIPPSLPPAATVYLSAPIPLQSGCSCGQWGSGCASAISVTPLPVSPGVGVAYDNTSGRVNRFTGQPSPETFFVFTLPVTAALIWFHTCDPSTTFSTYITLLSSCPSSSWTSSSVLASDNQGCVNNVEVLLLLGSCRVPAMLIVFLCVFSSLDHKPLAKS